MAAGARNPMTTVGKGIRGAHATAILGFTRRRITAACVRVQEKWQIARRTIGPLIVFFLLLPAEQPDTESAYRTIFWLAFIPAILAVLLLFFIRKEKTKPATQTNPITMPHEL